MTYMEKEESREIVLVGYYNVLFYLIFRVGLVKYKKNILIDRISSGEEMMVKEIYSWCQNSRCCWNADSFIGRIFQSQRIYGIYIHIAGLR